MNIRDIKASYLKENKRNYYCFKGYHIQKLWNGYWLTWLYNSKQFNTLTELKYFINNN